MPLGSARAGDASAFVGLPEALTGRLDQILDSRLAESSLKVVESALTHWEVVRERYGWEEVIRSNDPDRGGKIAAFVVYLVFEKDIAGATIVQYVWGLRQHMKMRRQRDPAKGVEEFEDLMQGVQVFAWVMSEPRRMIPIELVKATLQKVDATSFEEVQSAVLILMLLFTFARSETPCPKTLDGFDANQHLTVGDVTVRTVPSLHAAFRLKAYKQDRLIERQAARGNEDWLRVGHADGVFSILMWLRTLYALHGTERDPGSPFFVHPECHSRPLTYTRAMRDVRKLVARASSEETAALYGLHSLRVTGYTMTKRTLGERLAVAQGGWESDVHQRYEGIALSRVLRLPAALAGACDGEELDEVPGVDDTDGLGPEGLGLGGEVPEPEPVAAPAPEVVLASPAPNAANARPVVPVRLTVPRPRQRRGAARLQGEGAALTRANCVGRVVFMHRRWVHGVVPLMNAVDGWLVDVFEVRDSAAGPEAKVAFGSAAGRGEPAAASRWVPLMHLSEPVEAGAEGGSA